MSLWTIAQLNVQSSYLRLYLNDFVNHDTVFAQVHVQSSYLRLYLYEFVNHGTFFLPSEFVDHDTAVFAQLNVQRF